jgi:hypothetical protein
VVRSIWTTLERKTDGGDPMLRRVLAGVLITGAITATGCAKAPPPEKPSTVDTGQSARERAMQGMPANMQPKYQKQAEK